MANEDIRREVTDAGLHLWQLADAIGMLDCNFSRKLRHEFSPDEKRKIRSVITRLSKEAQNG